MSGNKSNYEPVLQECCMMVTVGIPMTREECEQQMKECGVVWEDFETEEECYLEMASNYLGLGYGADAVLCTEPKERHRIKSIKACGCPWH